MPFLSYEQVTVSNSVLTEADLTRPARATSVEIQAQSQPVRYTMDNSTDPTATTGMIFAVGDEPKQFGIDDLIRMRFIRGAGVDGLLNIHYFAGRDV